MTKMGTRAENCNPPLKLRKTLVKLRWRASASKMVHLNHTEIKRNSFIMQMTFNFTHLYIFVKAVIDFNVKILILTKVCLNFKEAL